MLHFFCLPGPTHVTSKNKTCYGFAFSYTTVVDLFGNGCRTKVTVCWLLYLLGK